MGDTTVAYDQPSVSPAVGGGAASYSIGDAIQLTGRPLLKPEEVIGTLAATDLTKPRKAIHFLRGVPPAKTDLHPWFTDPVAVARQQLGKG